MENFVIFVDACQNLKFEQKIVPIIIIVLPIVLKESKRNVQGVLCNKTQ